MGRGFTVSVSNEGLSALLHRQATEFQHDDIKKELEKSILKANITYGLDHELIAQIVEDPLSYTYPVTIARGEKPIAGMDAYLIKEKLNSDSNKRERLADIPEHMVTVKNGEVIATIIPATPGTDGMNVFGQRIKSFNGKEISITPGENVILHHHQYYSLIDGEVLLSKNKLSVLPIRIIEGDYSAARGVIKFDGNIVVKGNVLSGSELSASGNIRVEGTVENAKLQAQGYIYIKGGALGNQKGKIQAQGSIRATYLNQAVLESAQNIYIERSILHSVVLAKEHIYANRAAVIGGTLSTYGKIFVKDIGNHHHTYTEIELKDEDFILQEKLQDISQKLKELQIVKRKLDSIESKLKAHNNDHPLAVKHEKTKQHIEQEMTSMLDEQRHVKSLISMQKNKVAVTIFGDLYPQTKIKKGKYAKLFKKPQQDITIHFDQSEFIIRPIEDRRQMNHI